MIAAAGELYTLSGGTTDGNPEMIYLLPNEPLGQTPVVREATEADLDGLVDSYEAVADEGVHIGGQTPIDKAALKERMRAAYLDRENSIALVAEDQGKVVGTLFSTSHNGLADLGMLLLPEYRGQGIGSQMMERFVEWCRQHSCHKISLEVWPHNEAAIRLYEKFGFEREGVMRRHYRRKTGEIWDVLAMGLVLDED